jgi:hypothetical protein
MDDAGTVSELDLLGAIELARVLNARAGRILVHGLFVPYSFPHDVRNYACGSTPLCNAVNRLVESGVVVVVPSGNRGYVNAETVEGLQELATLMSITDPGNAERAITVGATHRLLPQLYGASFFSSRGPTLDGRNKPDLLAPGERILSADVAKAADSGRARGRKPRRATRRSATYMPRDGTSMAAAHVMGAVAALLSARPDLIGHPEAVKDLLLSTATDLGRPHWFQGRGLVNLSRALGDASASDKTVPIQDAGKLMTASSTDPVVADPQARKSPAVASARGKRFAVAFSFPGEDRAYVYQVVRALREASELNRSQIFYDKFYEGELSRPNVDVYFLDIYGNQSELVVVFLSANYESKEWCGGLEWRAIRDLIKRKEGHAVMPVRLDDTPIPGLLSIDGYVSAKKREPDQIADLILDRLQANRSLGT